jgi:hypothetical protein
MTFQFKGKRVVVTGGSRGIGRAIALGFAGAGADVSICARGRDALDATRTELEAKGRAHAAVCDLADGEAVKRYVADAATALGGIDVLVNNASGFGMGDDEAGWAAGLAVDVMAMVRGVARGAAAARAGARKLDHQHLVDLGTAAVSARGGLRGGQGGDDALHDQPGGNTRPQGNPRQLHRSRFDRISGRPLGTASAREGSAVHPDTRRDSVRADGHAGRDRRGGAVPGVGSCALDHRADPRRGHRMPFDVETITQRFRRLAPGGVDHASLRVVEEHSNTTRVRQDVVEPADRSIDRGAMVTVLAGDGIGYAATTDLSDAGLRAAIDRAVEWARLSRGHSVFDAAPKLPKASGSYASATARPLTLGAADRIDLLMRESNACRIDERIVDWEASLWTVRSRQLTASTDGGETLQEYDFTIPALHVVAHADGADADALVGRPLQRLLPAGRAGSNRALGLRRQRPRHGREVLQLLAAPNCPSGTHRPAADARPDDAADPRIDRPSARARPHPRRRAQLRRHQLRHARHVRYLPVRLEAAERHLRPGRSRGIRELRLRRRGQPRPSAVPDPRRPPAAPARRRHLAAARAGLPARAWPRAGLRLEPAADRPHGNLNVEPGDARRSRR